MCTVYTAYIYILYNSNTTTVVLIFLPGTMRVHTYTNNFDEVFPSGPSCTFFLLFFSAACLCMVRSVVWASSPPYPSTPKKRVCSRFCMAAPAKHHIGTELYHHNRAHAAHARHPFQILPLVYGSLHYCCAAVLHPVQQLSVIRGACRALMIPPRQYSSHKLNISHTSTTQTYG